ncbi:DNA-binding transcriptional regulator, XRE family [Lachnospiraceae bacterium XBD2001]|nr:DNA-binding transcriptional regulator, XRE family [Lachnospiraceae bacterium XBD2001]
MAVKYDKLFLKLQDRNMTAMDLTRAAGFSGNIMTRIKRNEYISLESIETICSVLQCKVDDIVEFVRVEEVLK